KAAGVKIGQAGGGAITVTQKITLGQPLNLIASGDITETGAGALEVDNLIVKSTAGKVDLSGDNKVKNFAGSSTGDFTFRDLLALNVGSVTICGDTIDGITAIGKKIT